MLVVQANANRLATRANGKVGWFCHVIWVVISHSSGQRLLPTATGGRLRHIVTVCLPATVFLAKRVPFQSRKKAAAPSRT